MRIVGERFRQTRSVRHKAHRRLALCGGLRHSAQVAGRIRTANYSQEARWRLARAIVQAREAAGYRSRPSFVKVAGISKRSLEAVESLEPDAPSVGETVLHAIARALPTWTEDTPRVILEGGPIPDNEPVPAQSDQPGDLAPLDEILAADLDGLKKIARLYAHFEARKAGREYDFADEERLMRWALNTRAEHAERERGISADGSSERDVS